MALAPIVGDLVLSDDGRSFVFVEGLARLQQRIALEFGTPLGTDRYDVTRGFDWFYFLDKQRTPAERKAMIRAKLLSFDEIVHVVSIDETIDKVARAAVYAYIAQTSIGESLSSAVAFPLRST